MTLGELLRLTIEGLEELQIPYAIVGSFASGVWGQPRMTLDIDVVVHVRRDQASDFCKLFSGGQFYLSRTAVDEAISAHRPFNVIHLDSGMKVDFMVVDDRGWNRAQLSRSVRLELLPGVSGNVASPEDVILGKVCYYNEGRSEKHVGDIAGILKNCGDHIDHGYLDQQARKLGIEGVWREILQQTHSG